MGVPLFFRWLRKKYPEIVDKVLLEENRVNYAAQFDNLYLDMNGILHPASHGDGVKVPSAPTYSFLTFSQANSDEDVQQNLYQHLDRVISLVKPKKLIYMALGSILFLQHRKVLLFGVHPPHCVGRF